MMRASMAVLKEASIQSVFYTIVYLNSVVWVAVVSQIGMQVDDASHFYGKPWLFLLQWMARIFVPHKDCLIFWSLLGLEPKDSATTIHITRGCGPFGKSLYKTHHKNFLLRRPLPNGSDENR